MDKFERKFACGHTYHIARVLTHTEVSNCIYRIAKIIEFRRAPQNMALAVMLRKFNAAAAIGQLKTTNNLINWKKTYTNFVAGGASIAITPTKSHQLVLKQIMDAHQRKFSLSARRMMAGVIDNHAVMWKVERFISALLVFVIPAAFLSPSKTLDTVLAIATVAHIHWGIEVIITDYMRPHLYGSLTPKAAHGLLLLLNMLTLGGMFHFINNNIGIAKSMQKLWATRSAENIPPPPPTPKKRAW